MAQLPDISTFNRENLFKTVLKDKFAKVAFTTTFVSPTARKYVIENAFSDKEEKDKLAEANKKTKAKNCIKHLNLFHLILQKAWLEIKP